jgi:hypothetical protein
MKDRVTRMHEAGCVAFSPGVDARSHFSQCSCEALEVDPSCWTVGGLI